MKKICSMLIIAAMIFSSVSGLAAKDYSNYTAVDNVGHCVTFDSDHGSALAINGSAETTDISACTVSAADSGANGNILKLSLSGNYSSAPYVASGDSGNGMLTYNAAKDMVVRVSMDAAFSEPSLVWSFFQTKGWSTATANTWMNGYAQMQVSGGKLIAAGRTIDGITIEANVFHNYMMILDIPEKIAYFYFDGVCVHENSLEGSGMLGFARWAANFPKSYAQDTYAYFDNITLQTLTNSFTAQLVSDDDVNACPYEYPDIRIKFSTDIDEQTLDYITVSEVGGKSVSYSGSYDSLNREYILGGMILKPASKYQIDISMVRAPGNAKPTGATVLGFSTAYSQGPDIENLGAVSGAGHDVNFDNDYSGSIVTSEGAQVEDVGGEHGKVLKFTLSGSYEASPYVASSDSGNGTLTYKQSENKIAMVSMDMMLSDTSSTWSFFQTKGWSTATANTWMNGYAQMQVSGGKLVAAGDTVQGVEIKPDVFYNYMMIADVPAQMVYFYLDGNCVHQKSLQGSGMLGYARWSSSFPKTYSKETYVYIDNVRLKVMSEGYSARIIGVSDVGTVPYEGKTGFSVEFSHEMNPVSVNSISITDSDGNHVAFDGTYDAAARRYVINKISLKPATEYKINLSDVCNFDDVGMAGASPYLLFTTQTTPVYAESISLNDNKIDVHLGNRTGKNIGVILIASYYNGDKFVLSSPSEHNVVAGGVDFGLNTKTTEADKIIIYLVYRDNLNFIEKHILQ